MQQYFTPFQENCLLFCRVPCHFWSLFFFIFLNRALLKILSFVIRKLLHTLSMRLDIFGLGFLFWGIEFLCFFLYSYKMSTATRMLKQSNILMNFPRRVLLNPAKRQCFNIPNDFSTLLMYKIKLYLRLDSDFCDKLTYQF